jgi:large subunit ribosomal protein L9
VQFDAVAAHIYNLAANKTGVMTIAKVLLTTTIDKLGHVGEVVNVAEGFARNYLLPRGLAITPTAHNMARFAKDRRLYGSVRPEDIATQIASICGEAIEVSRIHAEGTIDTLGPHTVTVSLYKDISVDVRVRVDEEAPQKEE